MLLKRKEREQSAAITKSRKPKSNLLVSRNPIEWVKSPVFVCVCGCSRFVRTTATKWMTDEERERERWCRQMKDFVSAKAEKNPKLNGSETLSLALLRLLFQKRAKRKIQFKPPNSNTKPSAEFNTNIIAAFEFANAQPFQLFYSAFPPNRPDPPLIAHTHTHTLVLALQNIRKR